MGIFRKLYSFCAIPCTCTFYENIGITITMAMAIAFLINAAWWFLVTIPLLKNYEQKHHVEHHEDIIKTSFQRLGHSLSEIKNNKGILLFLLAFFFYIDGVYTIIDMATAYGSALGLNTEGFAAGTACNTNRCLSCILYFSYLSKK